MQCDVITDVRETIFNTIQKCNMLSSGDRVLVGLSGGADSVCLFHNLVMLADKLQIKVFAAHLNHGIRGEEADEDADYVKELCKKLNIPLFYELADVSAVAKEEELSVEMAGRLVRYRFFHSICEKNNINKIATAHNKNDQAETVLMRIMRGTGIDGLAGIKYVRADGVVRPLLDVSRKEIESYCSIAGLRYCIDRTNNENKYTRNKIRNILIPQIEENFNPNIINTLSSFADTISADGQFINGYVNRLYKRINNPSPKSKPIVLDIKSLKMVELSIRSRLIRLAATDAMGKDYSLDKCHVELILSCLDKETGTQIELPKGLIVSVKYGWLTFETVGDVKKQREKLNYNGSFSFDFEIDKEYETDNYIFSFSVIDLPVKLEKNQMALDYDNIINENVVVRNRKKGDRISIYKDGRTKKLKDFMIDLKVPRYKRESIPLICNENNVIAVIGYRIGEPYKISNESKRGLVISYDTKDENR